MGNISCLLSKEENCQDTRTQAQSYRAMTTVISAVMLFFFLSYSIIKHEEIVWCMFFQWLFLLLFDTSRLLYS